MSGKSYASTKYPARWAQLMRVVLNTPFGHHIIELQPATRQELEEVWGLDEDDRASLSPDSFTWNVLQPPGKDVLCELWVEVKVREVDYNERLRFNVIAVEHVYDN